MSSTEEEYISPEDLTKHLETIIENIKNKKYSSSNRQNIFDVTEEYVTDVSQAIDPKFIEYLVRGWWISDIFNSMGNEESPVCPLCLLTSNAKNNENNV